MSTYSLESGTISSRMMPVKVQKASVPTMLCERTPFTPCRCLYAMHSVRNCADGSSSIMGLSVSRCTMGATVPKCWPMTALTKEHMPVLSLPCPEFDFEAVSIKGTSS